MKLSLWILIPALMFLTALYTIIPNFNYSWVDWINGNAIVSFGIGLVYLGEYSYKRCKNGS